VNRVVAIIVGTVLLLSVGFLLGRRPVGRLNEKVQQLTEAQTLVTAELRERAALAEARSYLWQARALLLIASQDVEQKNFGQAGQKTAEAQRLITRAAGVEGMHVDVGGVQEAVSAAVQALEALDPGARETLVNASRMLGAILDQERA